MSKKKAESGAKTSGSTAVAPLSPLPALPQKVTARSATMLFQCGFCTYNDCLGTEDCFEPSKIGVGCDKCTFARVHSSRLEDDIRTGLPAGFNQMGSVGIYDDHIYIFPSWSTLMTDFHTEYNRRNVPVWKYLTKDGCTIVRGLQPRNNKPFTHVFLEDVMDKVKCITITEEEVKEMETMLTEEAGV